MFNKFLIKTTLIISTISLLTACGGGSSQTESTGTPNPKYNGEWGDVCEYNAAFMEARILNVKIDDTTATIDFESYDNSSCSGNPINTGQIKYAIDFVGTQSPSTGVCPIDDKANAEITGYIANGISLTQAQIELIQTSSLNDGLPEYGLFCINEANDTLYFPDLTSGDGTSDATRPTQIDDTESIPRVSL